MTTKEFARQFGVSVSEMCEITGYTRQGLYLIINGKAGNSNKKKIAYNFLICRRLNDCSCTRSGT